MKKTVYPALLFLLFSFAGIAQKWTEGMQSPNGNLYQIQEDFERYWSTRDINEKGKGYKTFKRWEAFAAPRVYPTGDLHLLNQTAANWEAWKKEQPAAQVSNTGKPLGNSAAINSSTWIPMGPMGPVTSTTKSGRLNFLTIDPTNTLNLWVGAPAGGLWHSTNGGSTWSTNTDQLSVVGCSDLAIDPTNNSIMYLATGDGDAGDTRSIGVLKSIDGGLTWNATGLTNPVSNYFLIRRLIINPNNPQILLAATNTGIHRTVNGGVSWSVVSTSNAFDLEFKPGDPNTVYAGGNNFRISTNGGASFTTVTTGITGSFERSAIAVTPGDPNYVYILASDPGDSGFLALYRSTNSGAAFTSMSDGSQINILGFNSTGTDVGGNGWYDLCIAASPLNPDEIITGGVNAWRSTNGGTNWNLIGHWTATGAPFIHADHHDMEFAADGTLFSCNDGTLYRKTLTGWQEISGLMNISQIYKIGMSALTPNRWITGHQDNGTNIFQSNAYSSAFGGDGMDCFIDRTNDLNMFGETQNGGLRRSVNGGSSWGVCTGGLPATRPWVTIWKQDPITPSTLYCGVNQLFISTNLALSNWVQVGTMSNGAPIVEFAIAPSNNQVIYVLKGNGIYKTTDGGSTWTSASSGVPVSSAAPTFITIHPTDPNTAWVTLSGYSAGNKVFMTTNGGTSWTNYSANLPNLPANCSVFEPGSNNMIYIGMDVGIYYRNASSTQWTLYNAGLPNVPIRDLEMSAANPGEIYAATYGRGVWTASAYAATTPPNSSYSFNQNNLCLGSAITFTDNSDNLPSSWNWNISPSSGVSISSSTLQNPSVTFNAAGIYTVNLQANNNIGAGTVYSQVITIVNPPSILVSAAGATAVCRNQPIVLTASGANTFTWTTSNLPGATTTVYPIGLVTYTVNGTSNNCTASKTVQLNGIALPVVAITGPNLICVGDEIALTATGASSYNWGTGASTSSILVSPAAASSYSVEGTDNNGCKNSAFIFVSTTICDGVSFVKLNKAEFSVHPNPSKGILQLTWKESDSKTAEITMVDVNGRLLMKKQIETSQKHSAEFDISEFAAGVYYLQLKTDDGAQQLIPVIRAD